MYMQAITHKIDKTFKKKSVDSFKTSVTPLLPSPTLPPQGGAFCQLVPPGAFLTQLQLAFENPNHAREPSRGSISLTQGNKARTMSLEAWPPCHLSTPLSQGSPCLTPLPAYQIYSRLSDRCWLNPAHTHRTPHLLQGFIQCLLSTAAPPVTTGLDTLGV